MSYKKINQLSYTIFLRQKINFQEAGIQKLQTEYMASKLGHVFSEDDEAQELNGLETEPVKLSGNQTGTYNCYMTSVVRQCISANLTEKKSKFFLEY